MTLRCNKEQVLWECAHHVVQHEHSTCEGAPVAATHRVLHNCRPLPPDLLPRQTRRCQLICCRHAYDKGPLNYALQRDAGVGAQLIVTPTCRKHTGDCHGGKARVWKTRKVLCRYVGTTRYEMDKQHAADAQYANERPSPTLTARPRGLPVEAQDPLAQGCEPPLGLAILVAGAPPLLPTHTSELLLRRLVVARKPANKRTVQRLSTLPHGEKQQAASVCNAVDNGSLRAQMAYCTCSVPARE